MHNEGYGLLTEFEAWGILGWRLECRRMTAWVKVGRLQPYMNPARLQFHQHLVALAS
jgi:hypothetical protein